MELSMNGIPDWLSPIMNWIVVPLMGWLWHLTGKLSKNSTDIAVLQTKAEVHTRQYDQIMSKLDGIEAALRKD